MSKHRIFATSFASVYPLYIQKAERKNRTKEEVESQKQLDPLVVFMEILMQAHLATEEYFNAAEERVKATVEECVAFTENSPEPPLEELYTDVYAE